MSELKTLQHLIGVDKKNPYFTICRVKSSDNMELHVYWGATLIEIVLEDKLNPEYKLLIARLYNSGLKKVALKEAFGIAQTTMKRWGDALKSNDVARLSRVLAVPGAPRKITAEIQSFIELRFPQIYEQTHYNYSSQLRQEIKNVFKEEVSGETLRLILKKLKQKDTNDCDSESTIQPDAQDAADEKQADTCDSWKKENSKTPDKSSGLGNATENANRKHALTFHDRILFCNHLGVLLFSGFFEKISLALKEHADIIIQWFVSILLGAVNIEQTKLLDANSMNILLSSYRKTVSLQRDMLWVMKKEEPVNELCAFNAKMVNVMNCTDFYYDPHTKHYTGAKKILKGWCGNTKRIDKILDMDFIHTSSGDPVFVKHLDNFHNLRERFMKVIDEFKLVTDYDKKTTMTFVIDRAIYGFEVFKNVIAKKNIDLITWEKGYKKGQWDDEKTSGSFAVTRPRNHTHDLLKYEFEYIDRPWNKNSEMRQIIVKATNPKGNTIEVSVLATDKNRCAQEIIKLIFKRWIQENDFKYLIEHFGINQITSYAAVSYKEIKDLVDDKQMTSGKYKALQVQYKNLKQELGQLLTKKHMTKKQNNKNEERIKFLTQEIEKTKAELFSTQKTSSRIETLIDETCCKLDTSNKALMDNIKIVSRNMFYKLFEPFRELYNNYRDDHVVFRNLTKSHGILISKEKEVEIILFPTICYQPKIRNIIEKILEEINQTNPKIPDGSKRKIIFKLGQKLSKLSAI
jgi:hypothetical protein